VISAEGTTSEDLQLWMIRPHLDDVPEHPMPKGFTIRNWREGEDALWLDVQRDAEPLFTVTDDLFQQEFGFDRQGCAQRVFFLTTDKGVTVGTLSAWYSRDFYGEDAGRIHWVAVRPGYQGRGLARAGMSHALRWMQGRHRKAWLQTSSSRITAVKMYLDFGFVPDLQPAGAREAWEQVRRNLSHPTLESALEGQP